MMITLKLIFYSVAVVQIVSDYFCCCFYYCHSLYFVSASCYFCFGCFHLLFDCYCFLLVSLQKKKKLLNWFCYYYFRLILKFRLLEIFYSALF